MADNLKDLFNSALVASLTSDLNGAYPGLDVVKFEAECLDGLETLELTARAWHIAEAMHRHLPQPFDQASQVLVASLGPELADTDSFGLEPLGYLPHVFYVQKYGLDDFDTAMSTQYELTKRFSAESSIRAYLVKYPERTYDQLLTWSQDPNVHVRRLVSEGTRPRLPWAPRLRKFQEDPAPVIQLLDLLKDAPERYVQRSVANNINDIGKDHPDLAAEICQRWLAQPTPGRKWIVGHALRSLVKKGHPGALSLMGGGATPYVRIDDIKLTPPGVKIGDALQFSARLTSTAKSEQELIVDYAVHFVKANGKTSPKVFKLKRLKLPSLGSIELRGKISFAPMTTRRHFPGRHSIDLLINGVTYPLAEFHVT
jgi:3-methyladenine DNA glycosylase AlkC